MARHGYAKTTLATIVDLASVSRTTFYQHFANKQDCFLQTQAQILDHCVRNVTAAYAANEDGHAGLRAGLQAFMETVAADPDAAKLVAVESFGAGADAIRRHDEATEAFEQLFRAGFDRARNDGRVSDVTIRAIVGGIRRVVYVHLREGTAEKLPGYVDELFAWAMSYQQPGVNVPRKPAVRRTAPALAPAPAAGDHGSTAARRAQRLLGHRQRILDAVTALVTERGYAALTVPEISAAAGISNQTFYAHFSGKDEALLAAFGDVAADAVRTTSSAYDAATGWTQAVRAGVQALLRHMSARPAFARLAMLELPGAGPEAQRRADLAVDALAVFLQPSSDATPAPSSVRVDAIAGGICNVIRHEFLHGRMERLPAFGPSVTFIVLAPLLGAADAAAAASGGR